MQTRITSFALIAAAALCALSASAAQAQIINGDFEQGNTGFSTNYTYYAPGSVLQMPERGYTVASQANAAHNLFTALTDSPSVAGNQFMIINGDTAPGTIVWQQNNVGVTANSNVFFNMDLANVYPAEPAVLQFYIRRPSLGNSFAAFGNTFSNSTVATGAQSDWQTFSASFATVAGETSVDLFVVNQNTVPGGNDFAMDDLRLTSQAIGTNVTVVPEANTAALLGLALPMIGAVGVVRRRTGQNKVSSRKA